MFSLRPSLALPRTTWVGHCPSQGLSVLTCTMRVVGHQQGSGEHEGRRSLSPAAAPSPESPAKGFVHIPPQRALWDQSHPSADEETGQLAPNLVLFLP